MKIKQKAAFTIKPIPRHLRTAHIKAPSQQQITEKAYMAAVDAMGEQYDSVRENVKTMTTDFEELKKGIKTFADKEAVQNGRHMMVKGKSWEIGYIIVDVEPIIDPRKAAKYLPDDIILKCASIDPKKVADLINRGEISASMIKKITTTIPPQKRTHVVRIK